MIITSLFPIVILLIRPGQSAPIPSQCCCGCVDNCPVTLPGCPSPKDPCPKMVDSDDPPTIPACLQTPASIAPAVPPIQKPFKNSPLYRRLMQDVKDLSGLHPQNLLPAMFNSPSSSQQRSEPLIKPRMMSSGDSQNAKRHQKSDSALKDHLNKIHVTKILRVNLDNEPKNEPVQSLEKSLPSFLHEVNAIHSGETIETVVNDHINKPVLLPPNQGVNWPPRSDFSRTINMATVRIKTPASIPLQQPSSKILYYPSEFDVEPSTSKAHIDVMKQKMMRVHKMDDLVHSPLNDDYFDQLARVKIVPDKVPINTNNDKYGRESPLSTNGKRTFPPGRMMAEQVTTNNVHPITVNVAQPFTDITDPHSEKLFRIDSMLGDIEKTLVALRDQVIQEQEVLKNSDNFGLVTLPKLSPNYQDEKEAIRNIVESNVTHNKVNLYNEINEESPVYDILQKEEPNKRISNGEQYYYENLDHDQPTVYDDEVHAADDLLVEAKQIKKMDLPKAFHGKTMANSDERKDDDEVHTADDLLIEAKQIKKMDLPKAFHGKTMASSDERKLTLATVDLEPTRLSLATTSNDTVDLRTSLQRTTSTPLKLSIESEESKKFEDTITRVLDRIDGMAKNNDTEKVPTLMLFSNDVQSYLLDKLLNLMPYNHMGHGKRVVVEQQNVRVVRQAAAEQEYHCNSDQLRVVVENNIDGTDPVLSKHRIQNSAESSFSGRFDVICSREPFTYVISSRLFCEAAKDGVVCFAFLSEHPVKP